ncbi:MAG: TlpA family protein disulfide reductase, partial [Planctomycetota bacterium]
LDQYLKDVDTTWSPRGQTLISVGTKFRGETAEKQAAVAERGEFKWLKVFDPDAAVSNAWNVKTIPHLVLIDKEGKVVLAGNGFVAMPFVKKFLDKECPPKPKDE